LRAATEMRSAGTVQSRLRAVLDLLNEAAAAAPWWSSALTLAAGVHARGGELSRCVEAAKAALGRNPYDIMARLQMEECEVALL